MLQETKLRVLDSLFIPQRFTGRLSNAVLQRVSQKNRKDAEESLLSYQDEVQTMFGRIVAKVSYRKYRLLSLHRPTSHTCDQFEISKQMNEMADHSNLDQVDELEVSRTNLLFKKEKHRHFHSVVDNRIN